MARKRVGLQILAGVFVAAVLLLPAPKARAERGGWFINPGLKLGYTWGSGGGFTVGLEVSAIQAEELDDVFWGPVVNLDYRWGHDMRLRLGAEVCKLGVGMEAGALLSLGSGQLRFGFAATPWVWAAVVSPYYTYTHMFEGASSHEIGSYLKGSVGFFDGGVLYPHHFLFGISSDP